MAYAGGKGTLYRQLINLMPPHDVYIESHLGGGSVLRHKRPAQRSIGIDIDPVVLVRWKGDEVPGFGLHAGDAVRFLKVFRFRGTELVYADPPYLASTRRRAQVYRCDYSLQQHEELIATLRALPCNVMISGFASELYASALHDWNTREFLAGSHGLRHREQIWFNYEPPAVPHDLRYIGRDYRERQRIRRKQQRIRQRIDGLPEMERALLLEWMGSRYVNHTVATLGS